MAEMKSFDEVAGDEQNGTISAIAFPVQPTNKERVNREQRLTSNSVTLTLDLDLLLLVLLWRGNVNPRLALGVPLPSGRISIGIDKFEELVGLVGRGGLIGSGKKEEGDGETGHVERGLRYGKRTTSTRAFHSKEEEEWRDEPCRCQRGLVGP
jgi:hypothetical protein